jgi:spore germination protein YaaH
MVKKRFWLWLLAVVFFGLLVSVAAALWLINRPNTEHANASFYEVNKPIFYKGERYKETALGSKDGLKIPFSLLKEQIDPTAIYEEASKSLIITTQNKVIRMKTDQLTAMVNEQPLKLAFPVENNNGVIYVPIDPLLDIYGITFKEDVSTGFVTLLKQGDVVQWGKLTPGEKPEPVRTEPTIKAPILADVNRDESIMIWGEEQRGWFKVQAKNGTVGYMRKSEVQLDHTEVIPETKPETVHIPWKPIGGKINLTWEQVVSKNPKTSTIPEMPGLNVISPTWFHLADGEGKLTNLADAEYVKWAHSRNLQVWAIFSNGFEPKRTAAALSTYDRRINIIKQLVALSKSYKLQGINIDFENVNVSDKANLVQFVREMTPILHEQGLVVSIDVTPKSLSENWSLFYDRPALVSVVDYMMVMGYDEHWAASPVSGSVASLPWVEGSIKRLLDEDHIPPSKLVLGVPFYTRLWTEEQKDGKTTVSSKAITMDKTQTIIKDQKLKPVFDPSTGQNYVEYTEGEKLNRIWIEDSVSMRARMELVLKYDLAGLGSWRRGYETSDIWQTIQDTLTKKP